MLIDITTVCGILVAVFALLVQIGQRRFELAQQYSEGSGRSTTTSWRQEPMMSEHCTVSGTRGCVRTKWRSLPWDGSIDALGRCGTRGSPALRAGSESGETVSSSKY